MFVSLRSWCRQIGSNRFSRKHVGSYAVNLQAFFSEKVFGFCELAGKPIFTRLVWYGSAIVVGRRHIFTCFSAVCYEILLGQILRYF